MTATPIIAKAETVAIETQTEGFFVLKPEEDNFQAAETQTYDNKVVTEIATQIEPTIYVDRSVAQSLRQSH